MPPFPPKSILCPIDLSPASGAVLRWAGLLASIYSATVRILHAAWVDYPPYFLPSQESELAASAAHARRAVSTELEKLIAANLPAGIPHDAAVVEGHPVEQILSIARRQSPDLILMGSHGRSGLARLRLGSVAENVVRQATLPALVVRAAEQNPASPAISNILCPVTLDPHAGQSLAAASDLAAATGAHLVVLNVDEEGRPPAAYSARLCDLVPADVKSHCQVAELVRTGNAAEQILLAAREHRSDLIVLAACHRRFLDFTIIGSTTEKVMRHAEAAVLVLPDTSNHPA